MTLWLDQDELVHDSATCGCGVCTNFSAYARWFDFEGWIIDPMKLFERYRTENFWMISILPNQKKPCRKEWQSKPEDQYLMEYVVKRGVNLAVVAGRQSANDKGELVILDFDKREIPTTNIEWYRHFRTPICFTPHGFHIYLRMKKFNEKLVSAFLDVHCCSSNNLDSIRRSSMYALLPPSRVEGKSYWWLDSMRQEILVI